MVDVYCKSHDTDVNVAIYHYVTSTNPSLYNTHLDVTLAEGAKVNLTEYYPNDSFSGAGVHLCNRFLQLGPRSSCRHTIMREGESELASFSHTVVRSNADSHYSAFTLGTGSGYQRTFIQVDLVGRAAMADLYGLTMPLAHGAISTQVQVNHLLPQAVSRQHFKSAVAEHGVSGFRGKVYVKKDAQQTDAAQINHNLLLGKRAHAFSKPELEIYADDVKCAHGSTVGALDSDALFYLNSRGLPNTAAKKLLVQGFLFDILCHLDDPKQRRAAEFMLQNFLDGIE